MATLKIEIPDEASQIPELRERISWFVEEQIKINQWRDRHNSAEIDELVDTAISEGGRLREAGMTPDRARAEFLEQLRQIGQ